MAYKKVHETFWTDPEVSDDFTPDQKLFYLWMFTNPLVNQIGVFEFSSRRAGFETGYSKDTVETLLKFLIDKGKIVKDKKEILVINAIKHNFSKSPKYVAHVKKLLTEIKSSRIEEAAVNELNKLWNEPLEVDHPPKEEIITTKKAINIPFANAWNAYDKKVGSKYKCEGKWNKLKDDEREAFMNVVPTVKQVHPEKKYRPNFQTFINGKMWLDEAYSEPVMDKSTEALLNAADSDITF